ncbi:AMP-binding protein [Pseudomonas sp. NPDC089996]|uniref:AMP-binding protein n=1 Tax=Pseudomonas sp. NPDC089996 TaxID=3364474 RepID=UPI00381B5490
MYMPRSLSDAAALTPERLAVIDGDTGEHLSFRELDLRSNCLAHYLHGLGLKPGDRLAMLMDSQLQCFVACWAALHAGLCLVPLNLHWNTAEMAFVVEDSGAKALLAAWALRGTADDLAPLVPSCPLRLMLDGSLPGWTSFNPVTADCPAAALTAHCLGSILLYSAGTTGRPKRATPTARRLTGIAMSEPHPLFNLCGYDADAIHLSTSPLYHPASLLNALRVQSNGGTVVFMPAFDALHALKLIERYRITHSQWVPSMFVRLLKLTDSERRRHDLSSLRLANHTAAPCSIDVKRQMIDWWGPILLEYYGACETGALTALDSAQWLAHPGSVGVALPGISLRICDEDGWALPAGIPGIIQARRDPRQAWQTVEDIGYLDQEGYLYVNDRAAFTLVEAGRRMYSLEIEHALVLHDSVVDAAVIGTAMNSHGKGWVAVVEPAPGVVVSDLLCRELEAFLAGKLSAHLRPQALLFIKHLPRLPTGKLCKRRLLAWYEARH